jgi:hypothetical protein
MILGPRTLDRGTWPSQASAKCHDPQLHAKAALLMSPRRRHPPFKAGGVYGGVMVGQIDGHGGPPGDGNAAAPHPCSRGLLRNRRRLILQWSLKTSF